MTRRRLGRVVRLVLAGFLVSALLPLGGEWATASGLALKVTGNQLTDSSGHAVRLLGVAVSATEFACDQGSAPPYGWSIFGGPTNTTSAVQAMTTWHINAVRIPLNEDCWLGINQVKPAYGGASYQAAITGFVQLLHSKGLYVILDLHWNAPGTFPAQNQQPMADADHSLDFWRSLAGAFKADPAVAFELYNEPYIATWNTQGDPWTCWLQGCPVFKWQSPVTGTFRSAGMQQLVNAVRASGATQPVIANGLEWANAMSGWLSHAPSDPAHALVAGFHVYNGETCQTVACWAQNVAPITARFPLITTEFGEGDCKTQFINSYMPWADAHGISYLAWVWFPWGTTTSCGPGPVLIADWQGTPTPYGIGYRNHLAELATAPNNQRAPVASQPVRTPVKSSAASSSAPTVRNQSGPANPAVTARPLPGSSWPALLLHSPQLLVTLGLVLGLGAFLLIVRRLRQGRPANQLRESVPAGRTGTEG